MASVENMNRRKEYHVMQVESVKTALPEEKTEEAIKPQEDVVELPTQEKLPAKPEAEEVTGAVPEEDTVTAKATTLSEVAETRELTGEAKVVTQDMNVVEKEEETPKEVTVAEEAPKLAPETESKLVVEETAKLLLESTLEEIPKEAPEPVVEEKKEVSAEAVDISVPEAEAENPGEKVKEEEKRAVIEAKDGGCKVTAEKNE